MKKPIKNTRCRHMMYEQQTSHLPYKNTNDLFKAIESKLNPERVAMITHDKDVDDKSKPVAEHVHVMMSFKNARSVKNVAGIIGDKEQYIEIWNDKAENGYAYLVHRTKKASAKYQYDPLKVRANFNYAGELDKITKNVKKALDKNGRLKNNMEEFLDKIYKGEITREEVEEQITGSEYAKYKRQLEDVDGKRLQRTAVKFRRHMVQNGTPVRTYWICGRTGTGKSSLAKELAKRENRPYFFSGSTKDMFQNYKGEHTIILEEFRPGTVPYADLLRITDPYTQEVFAPARYHDKYLAADLIIITTPFMPLDFYRELGRVNSLNKAEDSFGQLQRRITLTLHLDQDSIYKAVYNMEKEDYEIDRQFPCSNPFSEKARTLSGTADTVDLFADTVDRLQDLMEPGKPDEKENGSHESECGPFLKNDNADGKRA